MSKSTLVLGESGSGKSTSLRNMDPKTTLLIQAMRKPLPFKSAAWQLFDAEKCPSGNIIVTDQSREIVQIMQMTKRPVIIIDDMQYTMANEYMRRCDERGFDKFTEIGRHAWDIFLAANALAPHVRVYILSHTETTDLGRMKIKTIGKLLDDKITLEGMVTNVLKTVVRDGEYMFQTHNGGNDTVKTAMGMFEADLIDNDLALVDKAICEYYGIEASK